MRQSSYGVTNGAGRSLSPPPAVSPIRRPPTPRRPGLGDLTPQERLVAMLVAEGLSNKEIASALGKAESTVKHQVAGCLDKFNEPTRARFIVRLWREGIVC